MKKVVLAYNFTEPRLKSLRLLCLTLKVGLLAVSRGDLLQPVGYLLGMEGSEPAPEKFSGEDCKDEMILMCGFDNVLVSRLLDMIKRSRLGQIKLKAVLTEHNAKWSGRQLMEELSEEHAYMNKKGAAAFHAKKNSDAAQDSRDDGTAASEK